MSHRIHRHRRLDTLVGVSLAGDCVVLAVALVLAFWIRFHSEVIPPGDQAATPAVRDYVTLKMFGGALLLALMWAQRLYTGNTLVQLRHVCRIVILSCVVWIPLFTGLALTFYLRPPVSRLFALVAGGTLCLCLLAWRVALDRVLKLPACARMLRKHAWIVGWSPEAARLVEAIHRDPRHPFLLDALIRTPATVAGDAPAFGMPPAIGDLDDIEALVPSRRPDAIVAVESALDHRSIVALSNLCEKEFIDFKVVPTHFDIFVSGLELQSISGVPVLGVTRLPLDAWENRFIKRALDLAGALVGLALSAPVTAFLVWRIRRESPGPAFYTQIRVGRDGRLFRMHKLRSMHLNAEQSGPQWAKADDPRRLKIGAWMRRHNLDEIPQFWNVLIGDMSLVGPRPERPELIATFKHEIPHYNARHRCRPGMSGWAQIHGLRGDTSLEERIRFDLFYLENWSPWLDLQILILTFFRSQNAY